MRQFDPFIIGVLIVVFERKVSSPFLVLCSLYSKVEDVSLHLFHFGFSNSIAIVLREKKSALFVISSWEREYFCKGVLMSVRMGV